MTGSRDDDIAASWEANAGAWATVVREARIPSRVAGSDRAILDSIRHHPPGRVLDAGCGEGWLARALAPEGYQVHGIDVSKPLIERARELGGGTFELLPYHELVRDPSQAGGPYDVVVLNFALFSESLSPLLAALGTLLTPTGVVIVQTVHPWSSAGEEGYSNGWRVEKFDSFGAPFPAPLPWFFRTLSGWMQEVVTSGLVIDRVEEPLHPETGKPISLLFTLRRPS